MAHTSGRFRISKRATLWITSVLASGVATPAAAQLAPVRQSIDANGVDLFLGTFNLQTPAISIGQGDATLAYQAITTGGGDTLTPSISTAGAAIVVGLGGTTDRFTISNGNYIPTEANGASLTYNSTAGIYTYVQANGTTIRFNKNTGKPGTYYSEGYAIDAVSPDGTKLIYTYDYIYYCSSSKEGSQGSICTSHSYDYRIAKVRNAFGYEAVFSYLSDDPGDSNDVGGVDLGSWGLRTGISLGNAARTGAGPSQSFSTSFASGASTLSIADARGTTAIRYVSGNVVGIKRAGQSEETVAVEYAGGRVTSVANANDKTTYASTDQGGTRTVTVTNAKLKTWTFEFDISLQRMTGRTDPLGRRTTWAYDSNGRVIRVTSPSGSYTQLTYDTRGNVTEQRTVSRTPGTPADIVSTASFPVTCSIAATCNQPVSTTDPNGQVTDYTYDPTHGGVLTVTKPAGADGVRPETRTSYAEITSTVTGAKIYRVSGISNCRTSSDCAGTADETKTAITYETSNLLPSSITTGSGDGLLTATTSVNYDAAGNATSVDGPLAGSDDTTNFTYDSVRQRTGVLAADPDAGGVLRRRATKYYYDGDGNPTRIENGVADAGWANYGVREQVDLTYDKFGRKTSEALIAGNITYARTDYTYDSLGRPSESIVRMFGQGSDRATITGYNEADQAVSVTSGSAPNYQSVEKQTYTPNGQIDSVTDANGNVTSYAYNGLDRLEKTTYHDGSYESLDYDKNGNVLGRLLRDGKTIQYSYDALNQLIRKDLPDAEPDVKYTYDLVGHPVTISETGNSVSLSYDALGRMTSEGQAFGTVKSTYDLAGRRIQLEWPDQFVVRYDYDTLGRMTNVRESGGMPLASYEYSDLGTRTAINRGNGVRTTLDYDPVSRLSILTHDLANTVADTTTNFEYNPAFQIVKTRRTTAAYAFNAYAGVDRAYSANTLNQYVMSGSVALGYDGRGNLVSSGGTTTYTYSAENRLTAVSGGTTLHYDPVGRLNEYDTTTSTRFLYDGMQAVAELANPSNAVTKRYVYGAGPDEPLVWYEGSGTSDRRWLVADERGSVIAATDRGGNSIATNTYDEFGIPGRGNVGRFQYTGQALMREIGLYYYKARFYSATLGRFLQTDPIGYGDGMNWYNYVGSDPVNENDPSGLKKSSPLPPPPPPPVGWAWEVNGKRLPSPCQAANGCQSLSLEAFQKAKQAFDVMPPDQRDIYVTGNRGRVKKSQRQQSKPSYCSSVAYRLGDAADTFGSTGKKFALGGMAAGAVTAVSGLGLGLLGASAKAYGYAGTLQLGGQVLKGFAAGQPLTPSVVGGFVSQALLPTTELGPIGQQSVSVVSDMVFSKTLDKVQPDRCD